MDNNFIIKELGPSDYLSMFKDGVEKKIKLSNASEGNVRKMVAPFKKIQVDVSPIVDNSTNDTEVKLNVVPEVSNPVEVTPKKVETGSVLDNINMLDTTFVTSLSSVTTVSSHPLRLTNNMVEKIMKNPTISSMKSVTEPIVEKNVTDMAGTTDGGVHNTNRFEVKVDSDELKTVVNEAFAKPENAIDLSHIDVKPVDNNDEVVDKMPKKFRGPSAPAKIGKNLDLPKGMGNNDIFSNVSLAMSSKSSTDVKLEKMDNGTIPNSERDVPIVVEERVDRGVVDNFSNELPVFSMNTDDEEVKKLFDEIKVVSDEIVEASNTHKKLSDELDKTNKDLKKSEEDKVNSLKKAKKFAEDLKEYRDKIQDENSEFKTKIKEAEDGIKRNKFYVEGIREIIDSQPNKQYVR